MCGERGEGGRREEEGEEVEDEGEGERKGQKRGNGLVGEGEGGQCGREMEREKGRE